jgi:hypothetical protein
VCIGCPDLAAVEQPAMIVARGACPHAGQVGAGVGLLMPIATNASPRTIFGISIWRWASEPKRNMSGAVCRSAIQWP